MFANRDFFALGTDASVAWVLYRLKNQGKIRLLARGLYDYPIFSKLLNEYLAPDMHLVAQALARKYHWNIQASGSAALQHLGLSTQLPLRTRYYSDGPTRSYLIEGRSLDFQHISHREALPNHPDSELFVQAVKELGERSLAAPYAEKICSLLTPDLRRNLTAALPQLTEQERSLIRKLMTLSPHE